jgi:protein-tyrosine phosphatase
MIDFVGTDAHHEKHIKAFEGRVLVKNLNPLKEAIKNNSFFEK